MSAEKLAAAKLWLTASPGEGQRVGCGDMPYLAVAMYAMSTVPTTGVATCTIDHRWRLYVNPNWLDQVPVQDLAVALAHCVWHVLSDHAARAESMQVGTREAASWHAAADVCLAALLTEAGLPHDLVSAADLQLPPGRSVEEYYAMLGRLALGQPPEVDAEGSGDEPDSSCGSGCDGLPRRYEVPDVDEAAGMVGLAEADRIRQAVAIAYRGHVTDRGTEPGGAWRWTEQVLESTVSWQQVLAASVRRSVAAVTGTVDYTYARPSRRRSALPNVILPGMRRPLPSVAVVVDTSGSVDDELLAQALAEVEGTLRGLGVAGARLKVLACDAAVHAVATVSRVTEVQLAGGGGTDMRVGIATAQKLRPTPEVIVVLSDGYTAWPEEPVPGVAVVAGLLGRRQSVLPPTPSWMVRVECVDGR